MAGKICPGCGKANLFKSNDGRECTNCGFKVIENTGSKGKGKECVICGRARVFNNKCLECGAKYIPGKK